MLAGESLVALEPPRADREPGAFFDDEADRGAPPVRREVQLAGHADLAKPLAEVEPQQLGDVSPHLLAVVVCSVSRNFRGNEPEPALARADLSTQQVVGETEVSGELDVLDVYARAFDDPKGQDVVGVQFPLVDLDGDEVETAVLIKFADIRHRSRDAVRVFAGPRIGRQFLEFVGGNRLVADELDAFEARVLDDVEGNGHFPIGRRQFTGPDVLKLADFQQLAGIALDDGGIVGLADLGTDASADAGLFNGAQAQ